MLKVAHLKKSDKVLDIACASGYSSAVISLLCKQVVAIEASTKLINEAKSAIENSGIENVSFVSADLSKGCAANAKYNKIFINGQVEQIPEGIIDQLLPGGVIVTIMKVEEQGKLPFIVTIMLDKKEVLSVKTHYQATAPMLSEFAKQPKFAL
jgi:protein-L-isoaspartate(D-aspartate) O-methyltransferase